jgi:hypothetical protein
MRAMISTLLAFGTIVAATPAAAKTYGIPYPVCLHVYGPVSYYECGYTSIGQCSASASGRAAQCEPNPHMAARPPVNAVRRQGPTY